MIRVLSIDGGGMKGIISAMVLERLEELLKIYSKNDNAVISDYFDLIGGTSTGAIIAALLLTPDDCGNAKFSASEIVRLYKDHGKEIFKKRTLYPINTLFGLFGSKYTSKQFEKLLIKYFQDLTLNDMRKESLYTSYNTSNRKAVMFSSLSTKEWEKNNYLIRDIVLASTAAPTYFPPRQIYNEHCPNNCHIDGGVVANNPSMCLLIESLKLSTPHDIKDTMLLSIGNASSPKYYDYNSVKHWGYTKWAFPILNIIMDGSEGTADYEVRQIFDNLNRSSQYVRIEKHVEGNIPDMDDVSTEAILNMVDIARALIKESDKKLKVFARQLVDSVK
ncbi:MAG: patatin-like phospholipase family protein [bacterium]|nr:patatin-like phospholipase family protein [bacterium]